MLALNHLMYLDYDSFTADTNVARSASLWIIYLFIYCCVLIYGVYERLNCKLGIGNLITLDCD